MISKLWAFPKNMSVHETTDVAVCDSKAIPPWPTLRSRPGLWKQSPRNFGGLRAQSQKLYMVGGLEQAPKIWVPVHSPGYCIVTGKHCSIQFTFHDFCMRFPTWPIFSLSTGTARLSSGRYICWQMLKLLILPLQDMGACFWEFNETRQWTIRIKIKNLVNHTLLDRKSSMAKPHVTTSQRWADCEIFQSESSPDPIKLNPIRSWSAKFLKIISPIQSWSANVKSCIYILPHEAKQQLELFCL